MAICSTLIGEALSNTAKDFYCKNGDAETAIQTG